MNNRYETVFLDRDGVVNEKAPGYVTSWDEFHILPGALDAITTISQSGRTVIVLTNQSAIAQKLVSQEEVATIHNRLAAMVVDHGGLIAAFLVCPHDRLDRCDCRKPAPGLFFRARDELGVNLADAVMVGDQKSDLEAAQAAGVDAILISPDSVPSSLPKSPTVVVRSLAEAATVICGS